MRRKWNVLGKVSVRICWRLLDSHFTKAGAIRHAKRVAKTKGFQMVQVGHSDRPGACWGWELEE
jgi:hypothetical protein